MARPARRAGGRAAPVRRGRRAAATLGPIDETPADRGLLRPGVALRSPLQDWLLRPRAVVVGPGEYAYLRQLTGVYAALGLPRAPLVPRLFAWLLPDGLRPHTVGQATGRGRPGARGCSPRRSTAGRRRPRRPCGRCWPRMPGCPGRGPRRWRPGACGAGAAGWPRPSTGCCGKRPGRQRPTEPAWVFPDGARQERALAWAAARALWGPDAGGGPAGGGRPPPGPGGRPATGANGTITVTRPEDRT